MIAKMHALSLIVTCLVASYVTSPSLAEEKDVSSDLPRSWKLKEIEKDTPPYGAEGKIYVLAWKIIEDERPLRVESCLVLKVLPEEDERGRWCLAQLYRHPLSKDSQWHLSMAHLSGERGTKYFPGLEVLHAKRFKSRPDNKAIYGSLSLEDVGWTFDLDKEWKFVGCGVCEDAWQAAIGEKPTKFFATAKK